MEEIEQPEVLEDFVRDGHLSIQIKTTGKIRGESEIIETKDTVNIVGSVTNYQTFTIIQHLLRQARKRTPKKYRESFCQNAIKAFSDGLNLD